MGYALCHVRATNKAKLDSKAHMHAASLLYARRTCPRLHPQEVRMNEEHPRKFLLDGACLPFRCDPATANATLILISVLLSSNSLFR
jgi:hypothetical protein